MKLRRVAFAFVLFALINTSIVFAQISAGLKGRVIDPSGAAIASAQVELTQTATNVHQSTTTTSAGDYVFSNLIPGSYQLDVTAAGFRHLQRSGVTVSVGQTISVDLSLSIGSDQQIVTVNGDAGREWPTGCDDLVEVQGVTAHAEDRDRVAAGVRRQEQSVLAVDDERALRRERIDGGARGARAVSAGCIGRGVRKGPVIVAGVGDDRVAGGVVGLHENGVVRARPGRCRLSQRRWGAQQRGGHRGRDDRQSDQISHGSSSNKWFRHVREG